MGKNARQGQASEKWQWRNLSDLTGVGCFFRPVSLEFSVRLMANRETGIVFITQECSS